MTIDLRAYDVPLYDVTGVFVGRVEPGGFGFRLDDVRLDASTTAQE